jgi:putative PIN family toxin of toxin-antitoxin system
MTVVLDTNVFVSAAASVIGSARMCFYLWARRRFGLAITEEVLHEYQEAAERLALKPGRYHGMNWQPLFYWVRDKAEHFETSPLGKRRSRDPKDDIFLSCALAAGAKIIVSYDLDLLDMKKPFGIEILKPIAFVSRFNN